MQDNHLESRLSQITTRWTLLRDAHEDSNTSGNQARNTLTTRYLGAVYRYLRAAVRDPGVADDLTQEFAVKLLSGRFHNADPARGRFRDYLKTCLFHLVHDHYRTKPREKATGFLADPADSRDDPQALDWLFVQSWRNELLAKAWAKLAEDEKRSGQPYHTVLKMRVENSDMRSGQLAEQLSASLERAMSAENFRQLVHRAHERFARFILAEIAATLQHPTQEEIAEELAELNLLAYCGPYRKA